MCVFFVVAAVFRQGSLFQVALSLRRCVRVLGVYTCKPCHHCDGLVVHTQVLCPKAAPRQLLDVTCSVANSPFCRSPALAVWHTCQASACGRPRGSGLQWLLQHLQVQVANGNAGVANLVACVGLSAVLRGVVLTEQLARSCSLPGSEVCNKLLCSHTVAPDGASGSR